MRKLTAALFDLDDTLHDETAAFHGAAEEVAREISAEHGIDALALKEAYLAESEGFWHRLTVDQLKTRLLTLRIVMWGTALTSMGLTDVDSLARRSAERYHRYRSERLRLFPGVLDLLAELRNRGVRLGLVTNGFAETHREKIERLKLAESFDAIFIADEVGMIKPDPLLFAYACRKLNAAPAETAMVGDLYERDIRGAHTAGLYTIWINVHGHTLPQGAPPADVTVEDFEGVRQAFATYAR